MYYKIRASTRIFYYYYINFSKLTVMRTLDEIKNDSIYKIAVNNNLILTQEDKEQLLALDKEYKDIFIEYWEKYCPMDCDNVDEDYKKFIKAREEGKEYVPIIKLSCDSISADWVSRAKELSKKFKGFNCFLSKYYIENLEYMCISAEMTLNKDDAYYRDVYNSHMNDYISIKDLNTAWQWIEKHPFIDHRDDQQYDGNDIQKEMQEHIDKRGFKFKVVQNPKMIARQSVRPADRTLHIKTDANFNDLDVESLKIHEVDVHVARRYYGYKTGLWLFVDGLHLRNKLDEGMAINQSLHHNKYGVKKNLEFEVAIKVVIGYYINKLSFNQLYDLLYKRVKTEQNKDIIGSIIFKNICRFKRVFENTSYLGGDGYSQTDYFMGYQLIQTFPESLREDIIKWNIGPDQVRDLPLIKLFFKYNKFEPLI